MGVSQIKRCQKRILYIFLLFLVVVPWSQRSRMGFLSKHIQALPPSPPRRHPCGFDVVEASPCRETTLETVEDGVDEDVFKSLTLTKDEAERSVCSQLNSFGVYCA